MINDKPRVRFAPSPTGFLHVGGLRTALYNYLFARKTGGKMILRIEDTDRTRFVEDAAQKLIEVLKWSGVEHDEGPDNEGEYGPYVQSERLDIYNKYAQELINKDKAYYAFDTPERLAELREQQYKDKLQPIYDKAALSLSKEEVKTKLANGEPHVIRMNVPPGETVVINDLVRGRIEMNTDIVDDQILIKSDGYPTYHLANVVDDHLMKITHVIRGEEWVSSTPKHVLLYQFLGWEVPEFAHLPLLLNPDKTKLSKRQGDVAVEDYRAKEYLPEALINFVAFLGWSPGKDKEVYSMDELIDRFDLNNVVKAGAVFDLQRLHWLNEQHLRMKPVEELLPLVKAELEKSNYANQNISDDHLKKIILAMLERVSFTSDFINKCTYFFEVPGEYDESIIQKKWKEETPNHLKKLIENFSELNNPGKEDYERVLKATAEELEIGAGKLIPNVRLAVSGQGTGPGFYDLLEILGKEEVIERINTAINKIKK